MSSIRAEHRGTDTLLMSAEGGDLLSCSGVPDSDSLINARRDEPAAVRAEGYAEDVIDVAPQREHLLPGCCIPELDGLIQA